MFWEVSNVNLYYGPYIIFLIIASIIGFLFLTKTINHNEKQIKRTIIIFGIIFLGLETYKQIFLNIIIKRNTYNWGIFPFQLCSTPIYFCLASTLCNIKRCNFIYAYLGSYALLGGLSVLVFPMSVFTNNVSMTMLSIVWHALMFVMGLYLIFHQKYGKNFKQFKMATISFLVVTSMAMLMNFVFEQVKRAKGLDAYFNMFYISPYYESNIIIMSDIWKHTNYYVFITIYILGIPLCSFIVWKVTALIRKLCEKKEGKITKCHM